MKCPNCGKENANDSAFCEHCGAKISVQNEVDYDQMCLNIMRVASEYDTILASYKARRKCYDVIKNKDNKLDYKLHVQQLQLDHFPKEFKKSLIGESYRRWLIGCIIAIVLSALGTILSLMNYNRVLWYGGHKDVIITALLIAICLLLLSIWLLVYQTKKKRKEIANLSNL